MIIAGAAVHHQLIPDDFRQDPAFTGSAVLHIFFFFIRLTASSTGIEQGRQIRIIDMAPM